VNFKPNLRRFHFQRDEDESGVSGTGRVAEGVQFSDGWCVVHWLSPMHSTNICVNIEAVKQIHGHGGKTKIIFDDADTHDQ